MESPEHIALVETLGAAMRERWPSALVTEDLPRVGRWRHFVGDHVPDVIAWAPTDGRIHAIGEAKRQQELWSERFRAQLLDWVSRDDMPICLVTSQGYANEFQSVVQVVVGDRAHARVEILEGPFWWCRRPGAANDWVWK